MPETTQPTPVNDPISLGLIEAAVSMCASSPMRDVASLCLRELRVARAALSAIRDAHADVQFDTPEDSAVQAKAVALADNVLARCLPNPS